MISKKNLQKFIGTNDEYLQINKKLIKVLGVEGAILYTYLLSAYLKKYDMLKSNDETYFICNVDEIQKNLNFSPFKQRNLLNELIKYKLLYMKYGQSRNRYISINQDLSVLENLIYETKYTIYTDKLISYIVKNIENFYQEEDLEIKDSLQFYNYLSKINFNKSIKESVEYKNLETNWSLLYESENQNNCIKELIKK